MTYKVGPKGQVVVPKAIRDRLGIRPGDEVEIESRDDGALIRPARRRSRLYASLADDEFDLLAALRSERRAELAREEQRFEERSP